MIGTLEQMGAVLPEPGAPSSQASAVAGAIAATAPGCAESPPVFAGPSAPLCLLLAGVAQVATLGPNARLAADALYEGAGCGATLSVTPAPGQLAPSVQAMACLVGVAAQQQRSAAFAQWGTWLSATAGCSPFHPLGSVPGALWPLVKEVPQLAGALGDSTAELCGIERGSGIPDPRCG
ncbi:MAG: hypothetical protein J2O39_10975 [Acidimicrobiales bacterium]|nr:hypothetical protein [Acidimicrobiales bacterium]